MTLNFEHVSYKIGSSALVDDVTLSIDEGEIVGLVGPNGAGKSTFANLVSGYLKPSSGKILLCGRSLKRLPPEAIARLGVGRTFQVSRLPWNLTCRQAIESVLGTPKSNHPSHDAQTLIQTMLGRFGLQVVEDLPVRDLSYGQQRLLSLAMVFARQSQVLILDEPFTGLRSSAVQTVVENIRAEAKHRAIVVIDHALPIIQLLVSRFWFMHRGKLAEFADYESLANSGQFRRYYLGIQSEGPTPAAALKNDRQSTNSRGNEEPAIAISGLSAGYGNKVVISDINLKVYPGDIASIIGLNGCGKSTLLRAVFGLAHRFHGEVIFFGGQSKRLAPDVITRTGARLLVQDYRVFRTLTVRENLLISAVGYSPRNRRWHAMGFSASADEIALVDTTLLALNGESGLSPNRVVGSLSGGEQARLALSQIQFGTPRLILLDEPTSGLDGVAIETLYAALKSWRETQIPVVMVEHTLDFVALVSTRVFALSGGSLREIRVSNAATGEDLAKEITIS